MGFWLALLVCAVGAMGLFYLDRDKARGPSNSLWLPVIWLWIVGSRPASAWLGIWLGIGQIGTSNGGLDAQLDGSPMDALVFMALLAAGIVVLFRRSSRAGALLKANLPILIYFSYCLLSVLWSPFPDVAFKRWTKDIGDLVMVLVVVTDPEPVEAVRRLFFRVGCTLLPASVLLIRYSNLGRGFDPDGNPMNTGVTTNKNTLGLIVFTISLGAAWGFLQVLSAKREPHRARRLVARGTLLALGVAVLAMAHSATSIACFILGTVLILATHLPLIRRRPGRVHALVLIILLSGGIAMLFGGTGSVVHALGRKTTLTGRTEIWKAVIPICPNPIVGAGFESFWNGYGKRVEGLSKYERENLNSSHNGYIDVYLNLGFVGEALIVLILISGYRRASEAFRRDPEISSLALAFVATSSIYSFTEAGFRILTPSWISLLLAVVAASGTASGLLRSVAPQLRRLRAGPIRTWTAYRSVHEPQ
jgi:exopolysaccharide production protein ExoQ